MHDTTSNVLCSAFKTSAAASTGCTADEDNKFRDLISVEIAGAQIFLFFTAELRVAPGKWSRSES